MKLTANSSPSAQFVGMRNNPSSRAFSDTSIVLSSYLEALSSLLAICSQNPDSENVVQGMYHNYTTLRQVRSDIDNDLAKADVTFEAIEARLSI